MRLYHSLTIILFWAANPDAFSAEEIPGQLVDLGGYQAHLYCSDNHAETNPLVLIDVGAGSWSLDALPVQSQLFANDISVCSWDRPGLGLSDAGQEAPTSKQIVEDMKAVIERSGLPTPLVLVGHSFGGQNVRLFAATYPELVSAVILVDSGHEDQWQQFDPIIWQAVAGQAEFTAGLARALRSGAEAPPPPVASDETLPEEWRKAVNEVFNNPRHFEGIASELLNIPESNNQLADSGDLGDMPLLVLTAGRSFYAYEGLIDTDINLANIAWLGLQRNLLELSSRSKQVVVPNVDHRLFQLEPGIVAEQIARFLRSE